MNPNLRRTLPVLLLAALGLSANASQTAAPARLQPRIGVIDNAARATLPNTRFSRNPAANDLGALAPETALPGITLVFSRSAAQEADLQALLAAQLDPASPQFHQWLTPETFAARFGMAAADLAAATAWLQAQGFSGVTVNRSHDRISFNGTAALVASALGAELHSFRQPDGASAFGPATDLSLPAALAANVLTVTNLSSFKPRAHVVHATAAQAAGAAAPQFTSSQSGAHFLTPGDVATIYDVNQVTNNLGFTGAGQSIVVIGQSFIYLSDIANFQTAIGQTLKDPVLVQVPNSGTATAYSGDMSESDLDLEYSSALAKGATVYFVYTGNGPNTNGAFGALTYAVDQDLAPIISSSYGACEPALGSSGFAQLNAVLAQAAAQGQTVLSASGDAGSSDCYGEYASNDLVDNQQLAVDFPASSQYVLAVGGTEFLSSAVAVGNTTYWAAQGSTDVVSSALSYIPEQVWNDDAVESTLASGGGGVSIYAPRPAWQQNAAVPGISAISGSFRLVPDVSLDAALANAPYAFCTSDSSYYQRSQQSSCSLGLRDISTQDLTLAGGTSFATPIFAGMLALINQAKGYTTGQGTVASVFYGLSTNATTYGQAFHDITTGGNQCAYTADCGAAAGAATNYAAVTGYDQASGLGSVDLYKLISAYPAASTAKSTATVTLTPATRTPALNATDAISIAVTGSAGTPGGSVNIEVDGALATTLNLISGATTYNFASSVAGQHVITAVYTGSGAYNSATATVSLVVGGSFTLTTPNISVTAGSSVTSSLTITPTNGYTGTVLYDLSGNQPGLAVACVGPANIYTTVSSATPVNTGFIIYTSVAGCTAAGLANTGLVLAQSGHAPALTAQPAGSQLASNRPHHPARTPLEIAAAGLLMLVGLRRKSWQRASRALRLTAGLALLLAISVAGVSGCSSSAAPAAALPGSSTTSNATPGAYVLTVTGYDSNNPALNSTTTFTLTIN